VFGSALLNAAERRYEALRLVRCERVFYSFAVAAEVDGVEDGEGAADAPHESDAEADDGIEAYLTHTYTSLLP